MDELSYIVTLRYIKPSKLGRSKLAEFVPSIPSNGEYSRGNTEVKTRVFIPEFIKFAGKLDFEIVENDKMIRTGDGASYLRLFVYAVVRQNIRSEERAERLRRIILELPLADIRYWASIFREVYERHGTRRGLMKPARGFKVVYDLA